MAAPKMITVVENNTRRVEVLALAVFSSKEKAERWIGEPNPALANKPPLDLVKTDKGFESVCDVLTRIESGTYS